MKYDVFNVSSSRQIVLSGKNRYINPEYHPDRTMFENDIVYICDGEWTITQDGDTFDVKTDDVIVLRAGGHHGGTVLCSPDTRTMFIHFTKSEGDIYDLLLSPEQLKANAINGNACLKTVIHCANFPDIRNMFNRIVNTYWSTRIDKENQNTLLIRVLLNELSYIVRNADQPEEEWIASALQIFQENPSKFFSLNEIAAIYNISVRTLTSHFKKYIGLSVHQYQLDFKLDLAYATIQTTNRTIQDIATSFGFYDAYQFSRLFKKKFGKPPKFFKMRNISMIAQQRAEE